MPERVIEVYGATRGAEELYWAYDDSSVPLVDLLLSLVWREGDADGWLAGQLATPVVFGCLETAREAHEMRPPVLAGLEDVYFSFRSSSTHSKRRAFAVWAAVRALRRARQDPDLAGSPVTARFAVELFGAATGHLARTDLAGMVGLVSRPRTKPEARDLEEKISRQARLAVIESPPPHLPDAAAFASYVGTTAAGLKDGPGRARRRDGFWWR